MSRGAEDDFRVSVADLGEPGRRRRVTVDAPADWRLELSRLGSRIRADITLESVAGGVVAKGEAAATVVHTCHRCLSDWEDEIAVGIDDVFRPGGDDDGDYALVGEVVDLAEPIRDRVLLEMPLLPTCREGCLGLCAVCGADLNTSSCPGHDEEVTSPFASLRDLLS